MAFGLPSIVAGDANPFSTSVLTKNFGPAGESPTLREPSPMWPWAGIQEKLSSEWWKPGMALEPGTGFGSAQRLASLSNGPMGFPFFFPFLSMTPGQYPTMPAPTPTEMQGAMTGLGGFKFPGSKGQYTLPGDLQQEIEQMNQSIRNFENFKPTELAGAPQPGGAVEQTFGTEPNFNLTSGEPMNPLMPENFNLGMDQPSSAVQMAKSLDDLRPLQSNFPNEADLANPTRWADTGFNLTGEGNEAVPIATDIMQGPGATAAGWAGPLGAASAAIPIIASQITKNPKILAPIQAGSSVGAGAAAIGSFMGPGAGAAASMGGLGGLTGLLGPAGAVVSLPFIFGAGMNALKGAYGDQWNWGHSPVPPGFFGVPNTSFYANPMTGEVIHRTSNYKWDYMNKDANGQPTAMTPDQARQWGMPIPGTDLSAEEMLRANPAMYNRILEARGNGVNPSDLTAGPHPGAAPVTINDIRSINTPGWQTWDADINKLKEAQPNTSPGELWRQWTVSPAGQAWQYQQMMNSLGRGRDAGGTEADTA